MFFTSDTHFNHKSILKYCDRPFDTVEEMNEQLIANWNSVVKPKDVIYHLGDFAYGSKEEMSKIFHRLNGRKHLVFGNHDDNRVKKLNWSTVNSYIEIKYKRKDLTEIPNSVKLILFHFPIEEWNGKYHGFYHLHGHSHGRCKKDSSFLRVDVGVDSNNFTPVHVEDLLFSKNDLQGE